MGGLTAAFAARQLSNLRGVVATTLLDFGDPEAFVQAGRWPWLGRLGLVAMRYAPSLFDRIWTPLSLAAPLHKMSANRSLQRYFIEDPLLGRKWTPGRFWRSRPRVQARAAGVAVPALAGASRRRPMDAARSQQTGV